MGFRGTWGGSGGGGTVTGVTGSAPIASSGGVAPDISISPATALLPGSMSAADKAKLDAITAIVTAVSGTAPIASSGGASPNISISAATTLAAGSMSSADKTKLDGIGSGANVVAVSATSPATLGGTAQNPSIGVQTFGAAQAGAVPSSGGGSANFLRADGSWATPAGTGVTSVGATAPIASSGGPTPTISIAAATAVVPGSMSAADKAKLDAIGTIVTSVGATAPITSSGGTTPNVGISAATTIAAGSMSAADKLKLDGIGAGANVVAVTASSPATLGGTAQNPSIGVQTFGAAQAGAVPLSGGGTSNFLRADGTWAAPPGGGSSVLVNTEFLEIAADTTTASGAFVDLLSQNITTGANFLIVNFSASFSNSQGFGIYQAVEFQMLVDGVVKRGGSVYVTAGVEYCAALVYRMAIAAAAHTVKIQWRTTGATARCRPVTTVLEHASLLLSEVTG